MKQYKRKDWLAEPKGYSYSTFRYTTPAYSLKTDNFSIMVATAAKPGSVISAGPPFIPIFPNLMHGVSKSPPEDFFTDIRYINISKIGQTIDLSQIKFKLDGQLMSPSKVATIKDSQFDHFDTAVIQQLNIDHLNLTIQSRDSVTVRFNFPINNFKVESLVIVFTNDEKSLNIPDLNLKSKGVLVYRPAYLQ